MRIRILRGLAVGLSFAAVACARNWSGPIAFAPGDPRGCPTGAASESCFDVGTGLLTTPLIVAPGRILVVTGTGLREDHGMIRHPMPGTPFVIEEITLAGHADLAQGYCTTKMAEAAALGLLRSGEIAVACLGYGSAPGCQSSGNHGCLASEVSLGVVDRARRAVDWRWRMLIPYVARPPNIHVVELGGRIGVVYPNWVDMHFPDNWALSLGPDGASVGLGEEDGLVVERELIALASVGENLVILFTEPTEAAFLEITVAPNLAKSIRTGKQLGPFSAGTPAPSCLSQDAAGTVTVTRPTVRFEGRPGNTEAVHGTLTLRYPKARLSRGADAYPSEDGRCVGGPAHPIRATRVGRRELIVYEKLPDAGGNVTLRVERR